MSESLAFDAATQGAEQDPPASLLRHLADAGLIRADAVPCALSGGRTNRVWRLGGSRGDVVLKLYAPSGDNPLFPNDPTAEALCLSDAGLRPVAPRLRARGADPQAGDWLLYDWIDGPHWAGQIEAAARALRQVHRLTPPQGLRRVVTDSAAIVAQAETLLARCRTPAARRIAAIRPDPVPKVATVPAVLLHGDPVASNIVLSPRGPVFIDWQCPGLGDPVHDIAVMLSPAMRLLYQGNAGTVGDADRFHAAYGDPAVRDRHAALAPLMHWRMAAYCLWRAEAGAPGYSAAAEAELSALT